MSAAMGEPEDGDSYWYRIFGLVVSSVFELPEASFPLPHPTPAERSDSVSIRRGVVPASLPGGRKLADWIEVAAEDCIYNIEHVCRVLVSRGRSIVVDVNPGVADTDVRAFLFGSALGTIVHQRRLVPLHVGMVQTPKGNIAFTGPSGAGKSTTIAALEKFNGWRILCDDMAVFDPASEPPLLHGGVRNNKLWSDAIAGLGLGDRPMSRDHSRYEKFHLMLERTPEVSTAPFRCLFELSWGNSIAISELSPANRFRLLMNAVYRPYLPAFFGTLPQVQQAALRLSNTVRAFALERPRELADLEALASAIADHCSHLE